MRYPREWLGVKDSRGLIFELVELDVNDDVMTGVSRCVKVWWPEERRPKPDVVLGWFWLYEPHHLHPLTPAAREALAISRGRR